MTRSRFPLVGLAALLAATASSATARLANAAEEEREEVRSGDRIPDRDFRLEEEAGADGESEEILGRATWFRERRLGVDGRIPKGAYAEGWAEVEHNVRKGLLRRPETASPGTKWSPVGPNISSANTGRIAAIAVDPSNAAVVYVGAASGGVWKSTNSGAAWTPLTDDQPASAIGSIAIAPSNPQIVYAGTGEANYSCDSYYGAGVLKSTNGGASWTMVGGADLAGTAISRIVVDPTNPNVLWLANTTGTPVSYTCSAPGAAATGVWKSTDGGGTWSLRSAGWAERVILDPNDATRSTLYAAFGASGVRKSTDAGLTWNQLAGGLPSVTGRTDVAIRAGDGALFFAWDNNTAGSSIWKSTDGGGTWAATTATPANLCNGYCFYFLGLEIAPDGAIWARGYSDYRSANDGASWTDVTSSLHVDHHAIAFGPNADVWVGSDGGLWNCVKSGVNCVTGTFVWTNRSSGLQTMQFYPGATQHPTVGTYAMAGSQDNGTNRYTGSTSWTKVIGGDGGFAAIDPVAPVNQYATTQYLVVWKTTNAGSSWNAATTGLTDSNTGNAPFIAPLEICPSNSLVLLGGARRVWRTGDGAANWAQFGPTSLAGGSLLDAISFAKSDATCNTFFVGSESGKAFRNTAAGSDLTDISTGLPGRTVQDIAVVPSSANIVFVGLSGFGPNLWKTTNALSGSPTWSSASTGLPNVPVNCVLIDPADSNIVMAGTDAGIFRSTDTGLTWSTFSYGLPKVPVFDLVGNATTKTILAFTHGRGAWKLVTQPPGEAAGSAPLTLRKEGPAYTFEWGIPTDACGATEYHLYRGDLSTLASGYSHGTSVFCGVSSALSVTVPAGNPAFVGDSYFLLTAGNGVSEGTYGFASGGAEIPPSAAKCRSSQNTATGCP